MLFSSFYCVLVRVLMCDCAVAVRLARVWVWPGKVSHAISPSRHCLHPSDSFTFPPMQIQTQGGTPKSRTRTSWWSLVTQMATVLEGYSVHKALVINWHLPCGSKYCVNRKLLRFINPLDKVHFLWLLYTMKWTAVTGGPTDISKQCTPVHSAYTLLSLSLSLYCLL